jgi:hypothetical protein
VAGPYAARAAATQLVVSNFVEREQSPAVKLSPLRVKAFAAVLGWRGGFLLTPPILILRGLFL